MVPKHFLPAYSRMLHLKKKEEYMMVIWPTVGYKQRGEKRQTETMHPPIDSVLKYVKS